MKLTVIFKHLWLTVILFLFIFLNRYLDRAVTDNSGIRKQDAAAVFASVSTNVIGQPLAFAFLRDQWKRVKE